MIQNLPLVYGVGGFAIPVPWSEQRSARLQVQTCRVLPGSRQQANLAVNSKDLIRIQSDKLQADGVRGPGVLCLIVCHAIATLPLTLRSTQNPD